ncbi:DUF4153 domain-containing protein [Pedobacter mucosus]|uniref:DUF4153 domain-containing protein n=1 Tax=Pedobacter mucosus TaxID=2895286 RepID=UPI001EE445FD|nr:DUF4153 domain-containing protein [Pedobacter mucosus]UKT63687.1 DUF4153 domain-containing protein [Pedobacter mucosus]
MKLLSIQTLYKGLNDVIKRFPIQFLFIVLATSCWCYYINISDNYDAKDNLQSLRELLTKLILISNLGLTLTLAIDLYAERSLFSYSKKWIFRVVSIFICVGLFFLLNPANYITDIYRSALLAFSFHLFVSFAPFIGKGNLNGFWQFNKALFLRFLTSAFYASVLYAGLAVALLAIDGLFNVDVNWKTYMIVFSFIAAGFSTIFFLAGVPKDFSFLDEDLAYPKGLKIFTQFVLIPLMTIYLLILLFYEARIILLWELPKGLVSSLIIGYAIFGILSLLLIYPMKDKEGNNWIKLFSRFFYVMLIPLIILLLLAVWKRVGPYGITESRYILVALALWLAGITVYFLFNKNQNIKIIPISLAIISLLAVYGPQSASEISKFSQYRRLKKIINSNKEEDQKEKPSIIRYLVGRHGLLVLQDLTKVDLKKIEDNIEKKNLPKYSLAYAKVDSALLVFKVKEYSKYANESYQQYTFINTNKGFVNVKGYDYLMESEEYGSIKDRDFEGQKISIERINKDKSLQITIGDSTLFKIDIAKIFTESVKNINDGKAKPINNNNEYQAAADKMTFSKKTDKYLFTYIFTKISSYKPTSNSQNPWINTEGYLLIKKF